MAGASRTSVAAPGLRPGVRGPDHFLAAPVISRSAASDRRDPEATAANQVAGQVLSVVLPYSHYTSILSIHCICAVAMQPVSGCRLAAVWCGGLVVCSCQVLYLVYRMRIVQYMVYA